MFKDIDLLINLLHRKESDIFSCSSYRRVH